MASVDDVGDLPFDGNAMLQSVQDQAYNKGQKRKPASSKQPGSSQLTIE